MGAEIYPSRLQQMVSFPADRIKVRSPENGKGKELEALGVRFLTVDITPTHLREEPKFKDNPLAISITEILPRGENGRGAFINAETHHEEATAVGVANDLRVLIAQMKKRPSLTVIATGLSEAVERLRGYLQAEDLDINRYFIDPWVPPQDDFQELAQNYLRFIISRYNLPLFDIFDLHTDPLETDLEPYLILGRLTDDHEREIMLYQWARERFPDISVVFDLVREQYVQEKLNQSLPDALFTYGNCNKTMTLECTGGKSVNEKSVKISLMHLISAMVEDNLVDPQEGSELYRNIRQELENQGYKVPASANKLLSIDGSRPIRREILTFDIEDRGVLRIPDSNRHRVLKGGKCFGEMQSSTGDGSRYLYIPEYIESCVILGTPEVGVAGSHMETKTIFLSVAVLDN